MQINRDNYSSYSKMIQQLLGGKNGTPDPYGTDYGNYSLRYTPTERPFTKPDWSNIATKQSSSTMSEKEFDLAIRELARKEFSSDNKDHKMIQGLMRKYQSVVAPDRKAIYEELTELTRQYDTWDWTKYNNFKARNLHLLFEQVGYKI